MRHKVLYIALIVIVIVVAGLLEYRSISQLALGLITLPLGATLAVANLVVLPRHNPPKQAQHIVEYVHYCVAFT